MSSNFADEMTVTNVQKIKQQATVLKSNTIDKIKESKTNQSLVSFWPWKDIKWEVVAAFIVIHTAGVYGILTFPYIQKWRTFLWVLIVGWCCGFGVTGGVHRYWCHRSYKANTALKIILSVCFLASGQNSIHNWVRDHRVHHKYTETDADPYNSRRGFFFSHMGWLMLKKHPEVIRKGRLIDMSDIVNDPVASFFDRYFHILRLLFSLIIPVLVPVIFLNECLYQSILIQLSRYMAALNFTWSVNSFAHIYGNKPYDRNIAPSENRFVAFVSLGEGWHNYHHCFPSDYRTAELGGYRGGIFNITLHLIDFFAKLGWAYDRNVPSESLVKMTIKNRGDGTH